MVRDMLGLLGCTQNGSRHTLKVFKILLRIIQSQNHHKKQNRRLNSPNAQQPFDLADQHPRSHRWVAIGRGRLAVSAQTSVALRLRYGDSMWTVDRVH